MLKDSPRRNERFSLSLSIVAPPVVNTIVVIVDVVVAGRFCPQLRCGAPRPPVRNGDWSNHEHLSDLGMLSEGHRDVSHVRGGVE